MTEKDVTKEEKKGSVVGKYHFWENLQNIAIIIAMVLGLRQKPAPGTPEEKQVPDWLISLLPEELSDEDEAWKNMVVNSSENPRALKIEREFRKNVQEDPEVYDIGKYRRRLMATRKEFVAEARKPGVKNEPDLRLIYETIKHVDPCKTFLLELVEEFDKGGSPEEIYERQKEIAILSDYLVKMSGVKKTINWIRKNVWKLIFAIILFPFFLLSVLYLLS